MQRQALDAETFLLRLAQYWAVVCATRIDRLAGKDPADQRTTTVMLQLYSHRQAIARRAVAGVEYDPETSSLRLMGKAFEESIGKGLKRAFKIFSQDEPFVRSVKTFARSRALSAWRKGAAPDLDRVSRLVERFQREAFVNLRDDLRYVGVLVATKERDGEVTLAFESLSAAQSRAYSLNLLKRINDGRRPAELPMVAGCLVLKAGDLPALRAALGVPDIRVVHHPAVEAVKERGEDALYALRHIRITGRTGTGKTSLLYRMATNATGVVLIVSRLANRDAIAAFLADREVTAVCDDAHLLPAGIVSTIVSAKGTSLLAAYPGTDESAVRTNSPELFAADVVPISLDAVDVAFLRAVTRSIAGRTSGPHDREATCRFRLTRSRLGCDAGWHQTLPSELGGSQMDGSGILAAR